jgi:hypothetical protein
MADSTTLSSSAPGLMEGVTEKINAEAVEAAARGEPEWLARRRREAWSLYERTPMPTSRLEEWRYTDLSEKLKLEGLTPAPWAERSFSRDDAPAELVRAMEADWDSTGHVVELDGAVAHVDLRPQRRFRRAGGSSRP